MVFSNLGMETSLIFPFVTAAHSRTIHKSSEKKSFLWEKTPQICVVFCKDDKVLRKWARSRKIKIFLTD